MLKESQQKLKQHIHDLESQMKSQVAVVNAKNAKLLEEKKAFKQTITDFKFSLTALEATRDQLESDRYNLENELEKKNQDHFQVYKCLCYIIY